MLHYASEFELLSEIHFSDVLIFQNIFGRSGGDQAAIAQYIGTAANTECFPHIVIGNQYANISFAQMADDALDIKH